MAPSGDRSVAEIPAEYTDGEYPLQFFLIAHSRDSGAAWLLPGLDQTLANQPYHIVYAKGS